MSQQILSICAAVNPSTSDSTFLPRQDPVLPGACHRSCRIWLLKRECLHREEWLQLRARRGLLRSFLLLSQSYGQSHVPLRNAGCEAHRHHHIYHRPHQLGEYQFLVCHHLSDSVNIVFIDEYNPESARHESWS